MRVIYTSKGMSKSLGCALYIRCALSIEKYGNLNINIFNISQYSRDNGLAILTFTFSLTACDVVTPVMGIGVELQDADTSPMTLLR